MQAIIFADRFGQELAPLCDKSCPALLPLANRPLLEYTLDDLAQAGIEEALIVVSPYAERVELQFGKGEMWGMRFRYLLSRGEETPDIVLQRYASLLKPPFLALRGDVFRAKICTSFIQQAQRFDDATVEALIDKRSAALYLVNHSEVKLPGLRWQQKSRSPVKQHIAFDNAKYSAIDSHANFYRTSLSLLENTQGHNTLPVREIGDDISAGRLSSVVADSSDGGHILVGDQAKVDASARIKGPLVIGHRCFIDKGANIGNSVIMPGTYVGEGLAVDNAIISGHHLIRIDFDSHIPVEDPLLLSDMENEVKTLLAPLPERLLGLLLLILSFPLWPIAIILALLQNSDSIFHKRNLIGNRTSPFGEMQEITALLISTTVPVLKNLPMLWLVARGDLRLFGCEPLAVINQNKSTPCWDPRQQLNAAGLLGPAQLNLPSNAPEEEIRMNEMVFIQDQGILTLFYRLLKSTALLFSTRAWHVAN